MRRILIVTNGPLCRNPRPLKEADTLGRAGYPVTVLTVRNHAPSEATDLEILQTAPFRREIVDMLPVRGGLAVWGRRFRLRFKTRRRRPRRHSRQNQVIVIPQAANRKL